MVSIEEALSIVKSQEVERDTLDLPLSESLGYSLGESIESPLNLPPFDNSAMDGYAICGTSKTFQVVSEIPAGSLEHVELKGGEAARIFTGGKIPINTTAVIMQEKTSVDGNTLFIDDEIVEGKNIRRLGGEIEKGQIVFEAGQKVTPSAIGMIASLGFTQVTVFKKPEINILTTGDELVPPGKELQEGQIYESNSVAISGAVQQYGFSTSSASQVADEYDKVNSKIKETLAKSDVLLISGGISVGEYDFVKRALEENRVEELFYKVFQKPGKPLFFGRKDSTFVFALPGNPASSLTCFYIYVLPLLHKLAGSINLGLQQLKAPLSAEFEMKSDRPTFFKASFENNSVSLLHAQGSSMVHSMAIGNCLVFLDGPKKYKQGDLVTCFLF